MTSSLIHRFPALWDLKETWIQRSYALYLGWLDVKQRYRRSKLGVFWITLSMAITIGVMGVVFGKVFHRDLKEYLPYLALGMILWNYISTVLVDGCNTYIESRFIILERPLPLFFHMVRMMTKNTVIFFHNFLMIPFLFLLMKITPTWTMALALWGIFQLLFFFSWISLISGVVCTRFRDFSQIATSILQIFFHMTPIIWQPSQVSERFAFFVLSWNPFYYLIEGIRMPLLGQVPPLWLWLTPILLNMIGGTAAFFFFNHYRNRIAYWV